MRNNFRPLLSLNGGQVRHLSATELIRCSVEHVKLTRPIANTNLVPGTCHIQGVWLWVYELEGCDRSGQIKKPDENVRAVCKKFP